MKENGRDTAPGQVKEPGTPGDPARGALGWRASRARRGPDAHPARGDRRHGARGRRGEGAPSGPHEWTTLTDDAPLPLGTAVDARRAGRDRLGGTDGVEQNAVVTGASSASTRTSSARARPSSSRGGDFSACTARRGRRQGARRGRARKRAKGGVVRGLWAAGKGRFRTKGRFGTASVRGTRWATVDRCTSTTVKVFDGVVDVHDLLTGRTVAVEAGESSSSAQPAR